MGEKEVCLAKKGNMLILMCQMLCVCKLVHGGFGFPDECLNKRQWDEARGGWHIYETCLAPADVISSAQLDHK